MEPEGAIEAQRLLAQMDLGHTERAQLHHLLHMAGLTSVDWQMLFKAAVVPDNDDFRVKCERMVLACKYHGFDPSVILRRIVQRWGNGKNAPRQEFHIATRTQQGDDLWTYSNHETLKDDMQFLILVFLNRHAVVQNIPKKYQRDFVRVMRMLCEKYGIRAERRGWSESLDPKVVTLPRISVVFPQMTCALFHRGYGRCIFDPRMVGEDLPLAMFSPMFPSVVSRTASANGQRQNIHPQLVLIAILSDNVLHQSDRPTPIDQIWTYYLASFNSPVLSLNQRHYMCEQFEMIHGTGFTQDILNIRHTCIERIRELRPHGRLDDIIHEMNNLF
ncbi:hypothetical protein KPH14_002789 [Odynerus spinipes]|uniref:Uncharacterized protein n=1 Tax=Odynerus spinipes TaxID=1348599 RepID=A0AAD9RLW8_9HYME|nr:hypothetical protein KPH14_002789 [Odynerus spinipes]